MRHTLFLIILLALTQSVPAASDIRFPRGYVCYKTSEYIKIDGKLNDAAWRKAPWTDYFIDIRGTNKPKPLYLTRSKMLWDDKYLYIGAYLEEPYVWAMRTKHDSFLYMENCFEVFIDPDGDNQMYYEIEINAFNAIWDLYMTKPYRDDGWNDGKFELPGIKHAVHIDGKLNSFNQKDKGWSVEYAIPWKALKVYANRPSPPSDGDQWRVNLLRIEHHITFNPKKSDKLPNLPIGMPENIRENFGSWTPLGAIDAHKPELFGYVQFSSGKPGTVKFRRDPDQEIRMYLMRIYFAEKTFFKRNNVWTTSFSELGLKPDNRFADSLKFELTDDGFVASIDSISNPGKRLNIRKDSRLWMEAK